MSIAPLSRPAESAADLTDIAAALTARFETARARRQPWESLWRECYDFALPSSAGGLSAPFSERRYERIYDGTAPDAADQLAASLLGNLTPPWTQWVGFRPGPDLSAHEAQNVAPALEKAGRIVAEHFDRSNFAVEIHQCFLDLVVGGTACLVFEDAGPGGFTAFRFTAVPLVQTVFEEGRSGALDGAFRTLEFTLEQMRARYPFAEIPAQVLREGDRDPQRKFPVLESILPDPEGTFARTALLTDAGGTPPVLLHTRLAASPVIAFRWMKSPGEIYGRSPVMKALPDIKTANKVVELVLKNASIAVTGIWQADDDGVLNPANIELVPGAIIPKAVGSEGLKPLDMPGKFDVSQLVLGDLRARIRHALLTDRLGQLSGPRMTATEVLERAAETALLLGATYGRLQAELLTPLARRAWDILRRRGEVPDLALDGRTVALEWRNPLAQAQGQRSAGNILSWLSTVQALGPEALAAADLPRAARLLGKSLGVPADLIRETHPVPLPAGERATDGTSGG